MEYQIFGAAKTVTGSCHSLTINKHKILIDCGMFQGSKKLTKKNYEPFGFNPREYKALLLTHAHLDHCGRIPKLVKEGFKGRIFCTDATKDLAKIVMLDSANIAKHDTEHENKRRERQGLPLREPIYTEADVKKALSLFEVVKYDHWLKLNSNIRFKYYDAGHILGASSIKIEITEDKNKKIMVFSGDIGQYGAPIVRDPAAIHEADYVVIESTYGDRLHEPIEKRKQKFYDIIKEAYDKKGKLLIPSFAIERTQEILFDLNEMIEKNLIPKIPVYLDSPMAIKATEVFKKHPEYYNRLVKGLLDSGDNPFSFPTLQYSKTVDQSKAIDKSKEPSIIIAGSGMCTAGRIKHHIKHFIWKSSTTLLFVGYQSEGTLGHHIKNGAKRIRLLGTEVIVKADIRAIESFSGHADYKGLLTWLKHFNKPKKVFINHGELESSEAFKKKVEKIGLKAHIPSMKEKIKL